MHTGSLQTSSIWMVAGPTFCLLHNFSLAIRTTWFCYFHRSVVTQVSIHSLTVASHTNSKGVSVFHLSASWSNCPPELYLIRMRKLFQWYTRMRNRVLARIRTLVRPGCCKNPEWPKRNSKRNETKWRGELGVRELSGSALQETR